jgi:hypothetical protein
MPKYTISKKKSGYGGFRIPTEATLDKYLAKMGPEVARKALLLKGKLPHKIKIFPKDLQRLREIGGGKWRVGFYRAIALAKEVWLTRPELDRLKRLDENGSARGALLRLMEQEEKRNEIS